MSVRSGTRLTMKKFLSLCLVAVMLVASVSVVASAAAADWVAGNGFDIIANDENNQKVTSAENSPVTVNDAADGVSVSHGGYYTNGEHWGGVASKDQYNLNGLEVAVRIDQIPEVTANDDCWFTVDFLEKPELFKVGAVPANRGFMCLVRFGRPYIEIYDGVAGFSQVANSQGYDHNEIFALKAGDVVKFKVTYDAATFQYKVTYTNGDTSYEVPETATAQLTDVYAEGKANVAIAASLLGSQPDAFKYTILSVTDGAEKTAEEKAAEAKAKEEAAKKAEEEKAAKEAEKAAKKAEKEAEKAAKAEAEANNEAEAETATDAVAAPVETGSNLGLIIAIIAIVVIVVVVVVVVVVKKKGSKK